MINVYTIINHIIQITDSLKTLSRNSLVQTGVKLSPYYPALEL